MGTQGTGRKRNSNKERSTAEDDALNLIAREAEARLAAKRAARAEAREIRMRELERQQKEIFQVQKKYYGLNPKSDDRSDSKWGDIEQWMEDSERYSRPSQTHTLSDEDERMSVGSRGSVRSDLDAVYGAGGSSLLSHKSKKKKKHKHKEKDRNGHDDEYSVLSSRPLEYSYRSSNSRTSSRANSARTSPVDNCGSVASLLRSTSSSRGLPRDLDDVTVPNFSDVDDRDYLEKGSRAASALTATTLASLGGTSSRRGSVETAITLDAETATREIKEIHELKDQIQDVESKYTQNLKEVKEALTEVEEKYRKAMVSNAQLDNEKSNLMYQVDTLKDSLTELEELLSESRREYEDKVKEFEREKYAHSVLQFQFNEMKETLKQSEELLNEIRQLHMKQETFAREITDLQETVEWKDKKIGALERQKEYTDAIRNERDELREEVVKLKDILKKHGIVLGPDLSINGDASETETDVATGGDAAPQLAQGSTTSPSEGNSMLGSSEETQLRSRGKEEVDQEPHGEVFVEGRTSHLMSADRLSRTDEESRPVIENDTQIAPPVANARDEILPSAIFQEDASPAETIPQVNCDLDETDTQMSGSTEENLTQPNKHETNQEGNLIETELFVQAVKEPCHQEDLADHETRCQVDVNESESCHQEDINDSESCPLQEVNNGSEPCLQLHVSFESCPQEDIQDSESCPKEDLQYAELCPHGEGVKHPESSLKVDAQDLESRSQEEDIIDPELCRQVDAKNSESYLQGDKQNSKSYSGLNVKDFESCPTEEDLKDSELCLEVERKDFELLPQDSIPSFDSRPRVEAKDSENDPHEDMKDLKSSLQVDVEDPESHPLKQDSKDPDLGLQLDSKESESCPQENVQDSKSHRQAEDGQNLELSPHVDVKDSELLPQDSIQSFDSRPQVDIKDCEKDPQEDMKDFESCLKEVLNYSESCPQVQTVKDSESSLQVDVKNSKSHPIAKDPELGPQLDSKESESCPQENVKDSKSYRQLEDSQNLELFPHVDVKDSEFCSQEGMQDIDLCPQVDVKNVESHPQEENIIDPESCPLVDVKNSDLCSQILVAKDSEPCLQLVDPESNTELQHETAKASSDESGNILTKPAPRKTRGKKKKKKRRGKKKGSSLEEQNQPRDKMEENVTDQANVQIADLGNDGSVADDSTDAQAIESLKEWTAHQVDEAEHTETSNVPNPKESKMEQMEQMLNPDEQKTERLEDEKLQTGPEVILTNTGHKRQESLDSVEVQEGFVKCCEPEFDHCQPDLTRDSETYDKDSILEDIGTVDISGQGDKTSLGVVQHEGETSSEATNYHKDDSIAKLEVESQAHFEASESQNQLHVTSTYDIGDSLQDAAALSPSEPPAAVNPDTLVEKVFQQEIREAKEPETECEYKFQKENEEFLDVVKLDNSLCDLDKEEDIVIELVADRQTLPCEDHVVDAASDAKKKARCEVSNDKSIEQPEEKHESSDQEVTFLDSYQQNSGEDDDDDDEDGKGHSFDFDDMDLDAAMEMETVEKAEQREVEEVLSDELNPDNESNAEKQKDGPENPEQPDVEMGVEALPDECSNNNNSNIEKPKDREACVHVPASDNKYEEKFLLDVESSAETVDNVNEEYHMMEDSETSIAGLPESTDKYQIASGATASPAEALDVVEKSKDLNVTLNHRETHVSGKDSKKNGKKGKNKGKDECKIVRACSPARQANTIDDEPHNDENLCACCLSSLTFCSVNPSMDACNFFFACMHLPHNPAPPSHRIYGSTHSRYVHLFLLCAVLICIHVNPLTSLIVFVDCVAVCLFSKLYFILFNFIYSPCHFLPEIRLRKLVDEREKMIEQIKKLKAQVDQKSPKNGTDGSLSTEDELLENGNDPNIIELQRDSSRQISDMKFKLVKAEQEVTALEQNVSRLEGQVSRYKSAAENTEKVEDELKAEKRKLQRELRSALDKVDELESNNSHLNKRLEKMKSNRGMAQTP
ncbi:uncharacterized protein lrrfip1a [Festucalex cinctus]